MYVYICIYLLYVYICYMYIFLCLYKCNNIFLCLYKCNNIFSEQEINARYEVLTAVLLRIQHSWVVRLCLWVKGFRRFDRSCYLHPQCQAIVLYCEKLKIKIFVHPFETPATF